MDNKSRAAPFNDYLRHLTRVVARLSGRFEDGLKSTALHPRRPSSLTCCCLLQFNGGTLICRGQGMTPERVPGGRPVCVFHQRCGKTPPAAAAASLLRPFAFLVRPRAVGVIHSKHAFVVSYRARPL